MRGFLTILVISSIVLSSCSRLRDSRLNPGNWFGKSEPRQVQTAQTAEDEINPLIPEERPSIFRRNKDKEANYQGTPVDQVTTLKVEPTPTGAIIRVTGIALQQGAYDVRLTNETDGEPVDGVLTYRLMAVQFTNTPQGAPQQRTLHAATFVSNADIDATRTIVVRGLRNEQVVRR